MRYLITIKFRELVGNIWMPCTYVAKASNKSLCFDLYSSSGCERNWSSFEAVSLLIFVLLISVFCCLCLTIYVSAPVLIYVLNLQIHTKKRNRLDVNRLNSLVYVQFNARLFNKHKKIKEKAVYVIVDDGNEETVEDWIVEQHQEDQTNDVGVVPNTQSPKVRELYDDDFESEEEDEVMIDMEFASRR